MKIGHHPEHTWSKTVMVRKVTNSSINFFSALNVVRCRNVELTTLNIALLRRQPKYYEIPFAFALALSSVFSIAFSEQFSFWTSYFCLFLMCL